MELVRLYIGRKTGNPSQYRFDGILMELSFSFFNGIGTLVLIFH